MKNWYDGREREKIHSFYGSIWTNSCQQHDLALFPMVSGEAKNLFTNQRSEIKRLPRRLFSSAIWYFIDIKTFIQYIYDGNDWKSRQKILFFSIHFFIFNFSSSHFIISFFYSADLEKKIIDAFLIFDHQGNKTVDVREVGTILRYLGCIPSENEINEIVSMTESEDSNGTVHLNRFLPLVSQLLAEHKYVFLMNSLHYFRRSNS